MGPRSVDMSNQTTQEWMMAELLRVGRRGSVVSWSPVRSGTRASFPGATRHLQDRKFAFGCGWSLPVPSSPVCNVFGRVHIHPWASCVCPMIPHPLPTAYASFSPWLFDVHQGEPHLVPNAPLWYRVFLRLV